MSFQIITIAIILCIFAVFAYGAARAEKAVAAKAQVTREAMQTKISSKMTASKTNKKITK